MATFILTNSFRTILDSDRVKAELLSVGYASVKDFIGAIVSRLNQFDNSLNLKGISFHTLTDTDKYVGVILDEQLNKKYNVCIIPPVLGTRSGFLTQQIFGFVSNLILSNTLSECDTALTDKPLIVVNCMIGKSLPNSALCNVVAAKVLGFFYLDLFNRKENFDTNSNNLIDFYNNLKKYKDVDKDFLIQGKSVIFNTERLKNLQGTLTNEPYYFAINSYPALILAYKEGYSIDISAFENWYKNIKNNKNIMAFLQTAKRLLSLRKQNKSLQQIYYGAPGTGKSFEINKITSTNNYATIRTTFHPDSDYSTFVGAYKPIMTKVDLRDLAGHIVEDGNNQPIKESRITYKFVKQAFLKAYLAAWKKYAEGSVDNVEPQFLVIEEINRGNCAQIFGDLFQLLDRTDDGFSSYPIEADADLQAEIENAFKSEKEYLLEKDLSIEGVVKNYTSNYGASLSEDVLCGRVLLLPNNLYIWATMNTSDQSLFPIDSAFKRRWDWRYVKITDAKKGWMIKCGSEACDWWTFVQEINKVIAVETSSDDKKLGYFFCKPENGGIAISEEKFVGKVLFYLWNDVFKDGNTSKFKVTEESEEPSFEDFYTTDDEGLTVVDKSALRQFLVNVVGEDELISDFDDDDELTTSQKGKPRFRLDGGEPKKMLEVVRDLVQKYADEHAEDSIAKIVEDINNRCKEGTDKVEGMLDKINPHFVVETEAMRNKRFDEMGRGGSDADHPVIVDLGNRGKIYINRNWKANNREPFIMIAEDNGWGKITEEK